MPYPHCEHVRAEDARFVVRFRCGMTRNGFEISWSSRGRDTSTDTLSTICYVYRAHARCLIGSYVVLGG
jgi:hypothetical protein